MAGHFSSLIATLGDASRPRIPVSVLTGFLGSGKTTLLNQLFRRHDLAGCAVIVNEFGEAGIDQDLIVQATEHTVLLANGCMCCAMRGDLVEALSGLHDTMGASLNRVVIETSGLADPGPILRTLTADPVITARFQLAVVACTVDAVHGARTLRDFPEAEAQASVADHLFITKLDQMGGTVSEELAHAIAEDRTQAVVHTDPDEYAAALELATRSAAGAPAADPGPWLRPVAPASTAQGSESARHAGGIASFVIRRTDPVPLAGLQAWLDMLAATRGSDLLRVKGIVRTAEDPERPMVIHGVQHLFAPPEMLAEWPSADTSTRIVIIARGLSAETAEHALDILCWRHARRSTQ